MRRARWLLLLLLCLLAGAVGAMYWKAREAEIARAPAPPEALPGEVKATANDWRWTHNVGAQTKVEVLARNFRQVEQLFELEGVELRIFKPDGRSFDRVRSAHATFHLGEGFLYSDGAVEIQMAQPAEGEKRGRLVTINSSGVRFESSTGKASTEREATLTFDEGDGRAVGASYDPTTRQLQLRSEVKLNWRGRGPKSRPMTMETAELVYVEDESVIRLSPWSRLNRDSLRLDAGPATVTLIHGALDSVEAPQARGSDRYPQREIEYSADQLRMKFSPRGEVEKITGDGNANLVVKAPTAVTRVNTSRIDLDFQAGEHDTTLNKALATGRAVVRSEPVVKPGAPVPDTRVLTSEVVELEMRPGGREVGSIVTHAPGQVEFLPGQSGSRRRRVDAFRMWLTYGAGNQLQSYRAVKVTTQSESPPRAPKMPPVIAVTSSENMKAEFDPKSGQMTQLEQWDEFRYQEGARQARAAHASLDQASNVITLRGSARAWDETGSTDADTIVLDQNSGNFSAEGSVTSMRKPDRKASSPSLLAEDQPLQAKAERMRSTANNEKLHYEGRVLMWQGANRLEAGAVDIDRKEKTLSARTNVVSRFQDQAPKDQRSRKAAPAFTTVRATELDYSDATRLAHYKGGVALSRPGLDVHSRELRAVLQSANTGSSLERAFADGAVEIVEKSADRIRRGTGEHGEYEVASEKVVLHGGQPVLDDNVRGTARGQRLTYFANDDRLLVDGLANQPAVSKINRK